jgi:hypothetical protein
MYERPENTALGNTGMDWGYGMLGRAKSDEEMSVLQKGLEKEEVIDGK